MIKDTKVYRRLTLAEVFEAISPTQVMLQPDPSSIKAVALISNLLIDKTFAVNGLLIQKSGEPAPQEPFDGE